VMGGESGLGECSARFCILSPKRRVLAAHGRLAFLKPASGTRIVQKPILLLLEFALNLNSPTGSKVISLSSLYMADRGVVCISWKGVGGSGGQTP
jgi:hypothetical protein